jgi:Bacteriophage head to tail connecting protein
MITRHAHLFDKYQDSTVISRCEQYAHWTLPYLMPDQSEIQGTGRVVVERDYQEVGALYVNNLASKLARILFPTQYPFFQAEASAPMVEHAKKRGIPEAQLRGMFARMEMAANKRLFVNSGYAALITALKHLIVTGQVLIYRDQEAGTMTAYGVNQFTTQRDGQGKLIDCILREYTTVAALPVELLTLLRKGTGSRYSNPNASVTKYTRIRRIQKAGGAYYQVTVELDSTPIGEPSRYPEKLCPWICPTWNVIAGEHYARGMVEDYAPGFAKLSALSEASALYSVETMRVINLVGASAGAEVDDYANHESGEWVRGDPNQISAHETGDARKLAAVEEQINRVEGRLARAFMYTVNTRDAERVTAYELKRDALEAEHALGGVYSTLSGGIQIPLAYLLMTEVYDMALPGIVAGDLTPDVTAGIPALGRASDVESMLMASQDMASLVPVAQLDKRIDPQKLVDMALAGRSVDPSTIFFSESEQKANNDAAEAERNASAQLLASQSLADQSQQINSSLSTGG